MRNTIEGLNGFLKDPAHQALAQPGRRLARRQPRHQPRHLAGHLEESQRPASLAYDAIVQEALAYGWIDSRPPSIDDQRSARLLTPRRPASNWSARNKARIEQLTAAGRMHAAGLAAVTAVTANGTWTALDETETLAEPVGLAAALDATPGARRHWDAFPRSARRAILEWITNAKTSTTREARIQRTADDAARNIRANQWRPPPSHRR